MLNKKNFKCQQCGECCKAYTIVLDNKDIIRIESLGYAKEFFAEKDYNPETNSIQYVLKRDNGKCIFLSFKDNKAHCEIYKNRPTICKTYPFFQEKIDSCKPKDLIKIAHFTKVFKY